MIQYLLSATIVWGASLLVYEALLKRETFHRWNRAYLLLTLFMGLVLPNLSFEKDVAASQSYYIRVPAERLHTARQTVDGAIHHTYVAVTHEVNWLLMLYLGGILISTLALLRELRWLHKIRSGARLQKTKHYTLIETGSDHGPFSFFRWIFIKDAASYEPGELAMILAHERRHIQLLHSLDLLFIQLLRVALWFHPLVWWYGRRLRMVHEYQADFRERPRAAAYSHFLVEQQLMQQPMAIVHSFFQSPIKNRIIMLTKNASSKISLAKYLLALPMAAVLMLACNEYNVKPAAKVNKGNKKMFKGNEFEMSAEVPQTIKILDSNGKEDTLTFNVSPFPIKMNGEKIYRVDSIGPRPVFNGPEINMAGYLHAKLKDNFDKLHDGEYHIVTPELIVDKSGHLVYYDDVHLIPYAKPEERNNPFKTGVVDLRFLTNSRPKDFYVQDSVAIKSIEAAAVRELEKGDFSYKPALLNGKPFISTAGDDEFDYKVVIKNHHSSFEPIPERVGVKFDVTE